MLAWFVDENLHDSFGNKVLFGINVFVGFGESDK